jgi:hypothetical protein
MNSFTETSMKTKINIVSWNGVVRRPLFGLLYQPQVIDEDECGAAGGMRIGRGNRSTPR